jgi:hypothetical protein
MPNTKNQVLFFDLFNKSNIKIITLTKDLDKLPPNTLYSIAFFDYIDSKKLHPIIKLEQYLDYENLDDDDLHRYGLTKEFIKKTILLATIDAKLAEKKSKEFNDRVEMMKNILKKNNYNLNN